MNTKIAPVLVAFAALSFGPATRADNISALLIGTSDPSAWRVSTNVSGVDTGNDPSRFKTGAGDFAAAVDYVGRADYIANNSNGSNGGVGNYTQFVFRQTFNLSGYVAATANLSFQWAADDTGQGYADRGSWLNRFTFNGSGFLGVDSGGYYDYNPDKIVTLTSGFVSGWNTIDFYTQGNGLYDGFELRTVSFTADRANGVPDSGSTLAMLGSVLVSLALLRRRIGN